MTGVAALLCCCEGGGGGECGDCDPVTITWSGSCVYNGSCCLVDTGGSVDAYNCAAWSATHAVKTSPEITNLCATQTVHTDFEAPDVGESCEADNCVFDPSIAVGCRLRFRLFPPGGSGYWRITVAGTGDIPSQCPNVVGGTGWSLEFRAAELGACPPASGWEYVEEASTLPLTDGFACGIAEFPFDAAVSEFTVGGVTVST